MTTNMRPVMPFDFYMTVAEFNRFSTPFAQALWIHVVT